MFPVGSHPLQFFHPARKTLNPKLIMIALLIAPMFAAAGFSLVYLLAGGGLFGAFIIFIVAKMIGK
jgi:hypothetical protein